METVDKLLPLHIAVPFQTPKKSPPHLGGTRVPGGVGLSPFSVPKLLGYLAHLTLSHPPSTEHRQHWFLKSRRHGNYFEEGSWATGPGSCRANGARRQSCVPALGRR